MGILSRIFGSGSPVEEIDPVAAAQAIADPDVQIVDCRTEREWKSGHLEEAQLLPLGTLGARLGELERERPVIVVCKSGHRSAIAARQLTGAGFVDVKSMKGGVDAWKRAGKPLVS
jgi:rhodanese-related sulfurtransferase